MKDTKTTNTTASQTTDTKKENVIQKLRDLSLEDLEFVSGGMAACDNNRPTNLT